MEAHASHTAHPVAGLQKREAPEPPDDDIMVISSGYGPPLARSAARLAPLPGVHAWPQSRRRLQSPALSLQRGVAHTA